MPLAPNIYFEADRFDLDDEDMHILNTIIDRLGRDSDYSLIIEGYSTKTEGNNLASQRTEVVENYLKERNFASRITETIIKNSDKGEPRVRLILKKN